MILLPAAVVGYMLLLAGLAVASPGVGFAGTFITFVPDGWQDGAHVPAYGLLGWLAIRGFLLRGWPSHYAVLCGTLLTMVFGLWTEVAQGSAPGRETSLKDLLNDAAGGLMAATLVSARYGWARNKAHPKSAQAVGLSCPLKGAPSR